MSDTLLFVYGTLRRGSGHALAARLAGESAWLGVAQVAGLLCRVDWYPALVLREGAARVTGDLVRLADARQSLGWLDAYEGCGPTDPVPHEYRRIGVTVIQDGERLVAEAYIWNRGIDGLPIVEGGDWLGAR